ncbi:hypothetical protein CONCODRAFT_74991 [Conidiobolus coronatus NRRL 28638]|uniref:Uncharacterized protein n=1 Tax=Conidiobolus coronatus (strain ATCC 28846 / CBS 209.66 / NRRL 28638) TaxID=796925 RepID=A0A137PFK6_CONC2|nr:hypothetical protein CONCODRAFT_74991 [Conidiobolus coronatus NRRL 28638]|eukprot:KXN73772.1 hypothetical protein CONCODRAFT_74991 [Conidiobolus coronatus NRRL 28638]
MTQTTIVPESEELIYSELVQLRSELKRLKKQAPNYDLNQLKRVYEELNIQDQGNDYDEYSNPVDKIIDDAYQIISLFWMALGKLHESPATYIQLVSIQQCLDHLLEFGVYTLDDLLPFQNRLNELGEILKVTEDKVKSKNYPARSICLRTLVLKKLAQCRSSLKKLMDQWEYRSDELVPIQDRLIQIRRELAIYVNQKIDDKTVFTRFLSELKDLDKLRIDGKFIGPDGVPLKGQTQVIGLMEECLEAIEEIQTSNHEDHSTFSPTHHKLFTLRRELHNLYLSRRWTLRETDLIKYQHQLNEFDATSQNGVYIDENGQPLTNQVLLHFLVQKCYSLLYKLLSASEPVAEALIPVYNQILTLRKCLYEVKKLGGPFTLRELFPYQIKFSSIENLMTNGQFLDTEGQAPEGQVILQALLKECKDILYQLKDMVDDDDED